MKRRGPAFVIALLVMGGALPAQAATTAPAVVAPTATPVAPTSAPVAKGLTISKQERFVAQGVTLTRYERIEPIGGWVEAQVLTVDLTQSNVKTDLLWSGKVADRNTVSSLVQSTGAIAGINADYFDTATVGASLSGAMTGGEMISNLAPGPGWGNVAGVGSDRLGHLTTLALAGQIQIATGQRSLDRLNQQLNTDEIGLFTAAWGTTPRRNAALWGARIKEVHVKDGKVIAIADQAGEGAIPADTQILLGREAGADWLAGLKVGDPVSITWGPKTGDGQSYRYLVGGAQVLLQGGQVLPTDQTREPRSAIGFTADGKRMFLVAVDGRSGRSAGMSLVSLAQFLKELGAADALNLDGGGSTDLVARPAGSATPSVVNTPSDGSERKIANGVGVWVNPGSGQVKQIQVDLATDRIFPGLSRQLALGTWDDSGAAVAANVTWTASKGQVSGLRFRAPTGTASSPSRITVTATAGGQSAGRTIQLLGPLQTLTADQPKLSLNGGPVAITLIGRDANGLTAPVDATDAVLSYDKARLKVVPLPDGRLEVTPLQASFTTWLTAVVQGKIAMIQVSAAQSLNTFSQRSAWKTSSAPQGLAITLEASPGYLSPGLKLSYDFTTSQSTRAAYLLPASTLALPGRPERIGLWVKGDGQGAWLRTVLLDASGKKLTLDLARNVTWTDWRYVEALIPTGVSYPLTLAQIYPVEPTATRQYKGALTFSDLRLNSGTVAAPTAPAKGGPADSLDLTLLTSGDLTGGGIRFAFLPQNATTAMRQKALDAGARVIFTAGPAPTLEGVTGAAAPDHPSTSVTSLETAGTRFLLLNASKGSLWGTDLAQLASLQAALKAAETAPVQQVILLANQHLGAWTDSREAGLIRSWLSDFRVQTGKGIALIGAGGTTAGATRLDGARLVNLPVGTGWYLGQIGTGAEWLQVAPRS
ncbi:MAG TPA: phosphodiester glycosidase family protein [Symbiobacteriaceae bacterium]|nr:phosphodiester glycosidase family protein [Symbiobacteriaceae bacterium]